MSESFLTSDRNSLKGQDAPQWFLPIDGINSLMEIIKNEPDMLCPLTLRQIKYDIMRPSLADGILCNNWTPNMGSWTILKNQDAPQELRIN